MKRLQSIILFITIALLLTAKAGLTIWHSNTDDVSQNMTKQSTPAKIADQPVAQPVAILQLQQDTTELQATVPDQPADSWAMLENYLIPEAKAASTNHVSTPVIEDKTLTSLRQYRDELEQRSKGLDAREKSLQQAEDKLKRRITELEQLEASIKQRLSDESKVKNKKIKRLTAVYEGMKADRAAPVIAKMELATVVKIFLLMDEKKVGKILSFLPPEKAVKISQALTRQISSVQ